MFALPRLLWLILPTMVMVLRPLLRVVARTK
jgi:hypothetical protein